MKEIEKKNGAAIPVLSRDDNFELKGSVTNDTYLDVYEEIATGRQYMVLKLHIGRCKWNGWTNEDYELEYLNHHDEEMAVYIDVYRLQISTF